MSSFLKALGYITGGVAVSYLSLTGMMQDPNKPYRGHLNIITDTDRNKNKSDENKSDENISTDNNQYVGTEIGLIRKPHSLNKKD
jgi:hypothetical protein|tara:strand:- start:121 stop:375 length:255 start_codon:yes stop_codon:yes gene_type:complete